MDSIRLHILLRMAAYYTFYNSNTLDMIWAKETIYAYKIPAVHNPVCPNKEDSLWDQRKCTYEPTKSGVPHMECNKRSTAISYQIFVAGLLFLNV